MASSPFSNTAGLYLNRAANSDSKKDAMDS
jgi:hypothetical protein